MVITVPPGIGREQVLSVLSSHMDTIPEHKVITSFGGKAIVRCEPGNVDNVISVVKTAWTESESLFVSGTLRTVREKYPDLKVPQKRKR